MKTPFQNHKIFLIGGPGGVGKTTLAAAIGVAFATQGFKTVVLTVDPAKRLAQALGLDNFQTDLQQVPLTNPPNAVLFASMLDTQRYFDKIIERFATSPDQKQKILSNPIYRTMVDSLGGTHEYAAMERLLEFAKDSRFERIIVDTPPTQNAIDLLNAPQRLADFMDNSVLKWFQGPKPYYLQLFKQGTKLAIKMIQKIFGSEFFDAFSKFMDDLEGMQAGFRQRHLQVLELLRDPQTAFLLVNRPTESRYFESMDFIRTLQDQKMALSGLILNGMERTAPKPWEFPAGISAQDREEMERLLRYQDALHTEQHVWVSKFKENWPKLPLFEVPKQREKLHEVTALSHLGSFLIN